MRMYIIIFIFICSYLGSFAKNYFISSSGENTHSGLSMDQPLASIKKGFELAEAGDTLLLMPGQFNGTTFVRQRNGLPDKPIVLKSLAEDPMNFAIIDGGSMPSSNAQKQGIRLEDCSWIVIENIIFRNCWRNVIALFDSEYITVRSCHFTSGKEVVYPRGNDAHHILVENCFVQHPDEVWKGWSWEELHHGSKAFYNGGLLHPRESGGGHVMRNNTLKNLFNGFRTRPDDIMQDGNIEIYNNTFVNIRDNDFEPEDWAWNIHYYYNRHINIHKAYSIDDVKGGNIYIYGNTYTQTKDAWALDEVSGIFKYKNGPLSYPCYAFNNSYYTEAKVLKEGEATNHLLKHFNNAYFFFQGSRRFRLDKWQPGYEFDYDLINQDFPDNIYNNGQESNGLSFTDALFEDGASGAFQLQANSPAIDAGKVMELPEFDWTQRYNGDAPDIGAYEGSQLTDGPPFRFIPSPNGARYEERPRITRHKIDANTLALYFSAPLDTQSLAGNFIQIFQQNKLLTVDTFYFPNHAYELFIETDEPIIPSEISILFLEKPVGINGLPVTYWASTIPIGTLVKAVPDLDSIPILLTSVDDIMDLKPMELKIQPNPSHGKTLFTLTGTDIQQHEHPILLIYNSNGKLVRTFEPSEKKANQLRYHIPQGLTKGIYIGIIKTGRILLSEKFMIY